MSDFLSGLDLSERLYQELVRPALAAQFPDLDYAAALLGWGSEVLGYDDPRSTDHNWGPRLQLFLPPAAFERQAPLVGRLLERALPATFYGYPLHFPVEVPAHQRALKDPDLLSTRNQVELHTVPAYLRRYLGIEIGQPLAAARWLLLPEHRLLGVTAGRVFHDGSGALERARARLAYYPEEVWRYRLAVQWARLAEQEAFVGRSGEVGDDLGSRLIAARQIRLLIRLAFLLERRYAPYAKWLGTAFSRLPLATDLAPLFNQALAAESWREREEALAGAATILARRQNRLQLVEPLDPATRPYHDRPYLVLFAGRFAAALLGTIQDETLNALPFPAGALDQLVDSDLIEDPSFIDWLASPYG